MRGPTPLAVEAPAGFTFANAPLAWAADGSALLESADGLDVPALPPGPLDEAAPVVAFDPEPEGALEGAAVGRPSNCATDSAVPAAHTSPADAPTCCQVPPLIFNVDAA
jgi:hypothetical protein